MASNSKGDNDMAKNIFSISPISYGDPCHDLYFHVRSPDNVIRMCISPEPTDEQVEQHNKACINYLKQLLPVAWSHNSLTTLKLIFNLNSLSGPGEKYFPAAFYTRRILAPPKPPQDAIMQHALLCQLRLLLPLDSSFVGPCRDSLHLLLEQGQESAAQRLYHDTHYKLLHDRYGGLGGAVKV
ncbi:uncharacterized protein Pyn_26445 [Prunus yedoensis var. nudiflora]|uniref:Uncharacterized protein n=1 Tax=Prunus yedoensis var. nudiflora TaxID=2094558 RepID=A0A314ZCS4_PRUYE|nr:uncharacterized protein Pyn_26445 [Prunus yedoensis var. nudiflora]